MGAPRGTRNSAQENRDMVVRYIKRHPGTDKATMIKGTGLTISQVNSSLMQLKDEVCTTIVGRGGGRTGTYYTRASILQAAVAGKLVGVRLARAEEIMRAKYGYLAPDLQIVGARVVRAGAIINAEYGRVSPDLRKMPRNAVKSAMD